MPQVDDVPTELNQDRIIDPRPLKSLRVGFSHEVVPRRSSFSHLRCLSSNVGNLHTDAHLCNFFVIGPCALSARVLILARSTIYLQMHYDDPSCSAARQNRPSSTFDGLQTTGRLQGLSSIVFISTTDSVGLRPSHLTGFGEWNKKY
jgi:hypothetical protein